MIQKEKRLHKRRRYRHSSIALSLAAACGLSACGTTKPVMNEAPETETEYTTEPQTELQAESEEINFAHLEATLKLLQLQYSEDFTFALNLPSYSFPELSETEPDSTREGSSEKEQRKDAETDFEQEQDYNAEAISEREQRPETGRDAEKEQETDAEKEQVVIIPENFAYDFPVIPGTIKIQRELRQFPLPILPVNISLLENQVHTLLDTYSGEWSVYVKNLTTGDSFLIGDQPMKSASVMKLFIMGTVYNAIDKGVLERTDEVVELLNNMISYSSNEASNRLLSLLGNGSYEKGIEKVNQYITDHHYEGDTREYNGFNDANTILDENHFNQVSAKDCGKLLERIYHRTFGSRKVCNEIETMMLNQNTRYKIPAGLPEGVLVGNKTGEMDTVENDVAIIYSDKSDYILCVLSCDWNSKNEAISHIAEISSTVYDFFNDEAYYLNTPDLTAYDYEIADYQPIDVDSIKYTVEDNTASMEYTEEASTDPVEYIIEETENETERGTES